MIVTHIDGTTEYVTDYKNLQRKRRVNGEYSLSFLLIKTDRNEHSYPLSVEESIIEYDGQEYRIKKMTEKTIGNTPVKQIHADHVFFDLVDVFQYDTISGFKQLHVCLAHALQGTDYTFDVIDPFPSVEFENFGNDNALALIQTCLNRFGAEVAINGKHLTFKRQIGRKTDIQFRYKHNIKTIEKYVDTTNLSTYIKGFGKQNEDGSYVVTAEYLSPMHEVYGIRHAKPVYDERYTTYEGLMQRLQDELQDVPDVSFTIEAAELLKAGVNTEQLELGDEIFVIYEPLNIDISARVVEIVDFPEEPKSSQLTIANFRENFTESVADFQRTKDRIDGIFEGKEKLPFNVLDDAVQRSTRALQSAQTELKFENGILAIDPTDPNRLVLLNSKGIGISNDGGKTFKEAITADGFVLSAGAVGKLSANHIFADNLAAISANLGTVRSGYIQSSTFKTNEKAPYGLLKSDGTLVLASFDDDIDNNNYIAGDVGIKIDPSSFFDEPTVSFHLSYYHNASGELKGIGEAEIFLFGNPSNPNDEPVFCLRNDGPINFYAFSSESGKSEFEFFGSVEVRGDLDVWGSKPATVPTSAGYVRVTAYETAEYYFGDIGRGEVVNGECKIEIESLFKETVNTEIDYQVFLTPYGPGQIYVAKMTPDYFVVKGDDIKFAYEIKAKRKGYEDVRLELR